MVPVSVVMPTYNTPVDILSVAVESILGQTFKDFELIILDDCSDKKETLDYLASLRDNRVRIIRNTENIGITKSLNVGFRAALGKYIARMDSDDIALPQRLEKQHSFMEAHRDSIVCGSYVKEFGDKNGVWKVATDDQELYRIKLLFYNTGPSHPSVMYRKDKLISNNLWYDERLKYAQDYMMWVNVSLVGTISCVEEVLLWYRYHKGQASAEKAKEQSRCSTFVRKKQLEKLLDNVTMQDAENHFSYYLEKMITEDSFKWFIKLIAANDQKGVYNKEKFRAYVLDLIARKVYATYDIHWKDPRSYPILFKYLPASYVLNEVKKKAANKLGLNKKT